MEITNILNVIATNKKLNSSIVLTRCPETPVMNFEELAKDLLVGLSANGDTTTCVESDPTGSLLTIVVPNSKSVLYLRAAATKIQAGKVLGIVLYRSMAITSAFTLIAKSITNIHYFSNVGERSSYRDLELNFRSLFEFNTFYNAALYIEERLNIPVSLLSACEVKTYPAFVDSLMQENILPPNSKKSPTGDSNVAPQVDSAKAESILKAAAKAKTPKSKRVKGKVYFDVPTLPANLNNVEYCKQFMESKEVISMIRSGLGNVKFNSLENPDDLKPLFLALSGEYSFQAMTVFFESLFTAPECSTISCVGFFLIVAGGLAHNNLPRRKDFDWANHHIDFGMLFEALSKGQSKELATLLEVGYFKRSTTEYKVRDIGSKAITVSVDLSSMDFQTTEILRYTDNDLDDHAFLAKSLYTKVQSSCGTFPALFMTLKSIFMGD